MFCPCEDKKKNCCKIPAIKSGEIGKRLEPVLREMEKSGVFVDVEKINQLKDKVSKKIETVRKEILKELKTEINLDSPIKLADLLFNKLKLPTEDLKRTQSGFSTAASELFKIKSAHPAIPKILKYREYTKLDTTYLTPLPKLVDKNNRLHTHYSQDARTGRLTSSEPNLQNIPIKGEYGEEIRSTIIAPKGYKLVAADYSQIELRIIACLANDRTMIKVFNEGGDIHTQTASIIFHKPMGQVTSDERRSAKTINFGILYGMSPFGLSQALSIHQEEAARYIFEYFENHQGVKRYMENVIFKAQKTGYVETLFGFRRPTIEINSPHRGAREAEERIAVNTPIQGTAAEILKLAMVGLNQKLRSKAKLILTVHDELVIEAPEKEAKNIEKMMKETMEGVVKLCVPITVETGIGQNWDECKQ